MPIKEYDINYNNVELNEYYTHLIWEKDLDEKLDFIAKEVLSYGFNNKNADCSIEEMIAISKYQFLQASSEKRFAYKLTQEENNENFKLPDNLINPENKNEEYKIKEKEFVKNPVKVIKEYAIYEANKEIDENDQEQVKWKNHCKEMVNKLTNLEPTYLETEKEAQPIIVTYLVGRERYINEVKSCNDILNKTKGGFFERFFRTTSNEYNNFKNTFRAYNDKNNQNYGNKEALKNAAIAYIRHKVPNLLEGEEPTYESIENLKGTAYERARLCISILDQFKDQEKMENLGNNFINFNNQVNDIEQNDFQKNLGNDLEENMEIKAQINDMDNEADKEIEMVNK